VKYIDLILCYLLYYKSEKFSFLVQYIIIHATYEGIYVEFERKANSTLMFLLSNCLQVLDIF